MFTEGIKIYHITHISNVVGIVNQGLILSDAKMLSSGARHTSIGMSSIKKRRLNLPVRCNPPTTVGQYVPFYFCARSIMLYVLHMGNHPDMSFHDGQGSIVHLQSDLNKTIRWAKVQGKPWAFSDTNAGAGYANFYNSLNSLSCLDFDAIFKTDFSGPRTKEGKQAEFLFLDAFPWLLVEHIGVINAAMVRNVGNALTASEHKPTVSVEPEWYF